MTRLAFGAKCGFLGASGYTPVILLAAESLFSPSKVPKAIAPRPTPHSLKNQRRVMCCRYALKKCSGVVMGSFFGDGFVEIQKHPRDDGVSGPLRRSRAWREVRGRLALAGGDLARVQPSLGDAL